MRELIACWRHTRMIVLIALCAALFVAVLLPFKIATIIPGITEIRPAAALPIFFSIFFGPAAAWGTGFGNLIGDVLGGTIGPGSFFGVLGNLVYGFVPYRMLRRLNDRTRLWSLTGWMLFAFQLFLASALCATIIALGVDVIGIPFAFLVHTIFLNNIIVSLILVPLLVRALGKRIVGMKLSYEQILLKEEISDPPLGIAGIVIVTALMLLLYSIMMFPGMLESIPVPPDVFKVTSSILLTLVALLLL